MRSFDTKWIAGLAASLAALLLYSPSAAWGHWPDQAPHQIANLGEFRFEGGGMIPNLKMSYVTHGKLNAAKDNAILFQHGFVANHHLFDHMIGPGRPLDTDKYFIICPDALGATQTRSEHSTSPTNSGLNIAFPLYNGRDMVRAQHKLITEALGISHLLAVTGISSGADHSVQFAVSFTLATGGSTTSQYFCCMLGANREFVQRYPVTTKRAMRAILKAADLCDSEPLKVARFLSDKLYEPRYQVGLEVVKSLPYNRWREANPEDTIRFHALRLHEVGMIKSTPQKLIAQGTDWRFLNELKRELKA